jgi:hypothetical protein
MRKSEFIFVNEACILDVAEIPDCTRLSDTPAIQVDKQCAVA